MIKYLWHKLKETIWLTKTLCYKSIKTFLSAYKPANRCTRTCDCN